MGIGVGELSDAKSRRRWGRRAEYVASEHA